MGTAENEETIRRIYEALENGDRSVFGASVRPDYVWRFRPEQLVEALCRTGRGSQQSAETAVCAVRHRVPGARHQPCRRGRLSRRRVAATFRPGPASATTTNTALSSFRGGKIAEMVEYCDTDLEERVLGDYEDAVRMWLRSKNLKISAVFLHDRPEAPSLDAAWAQRRYDRNHSRPAIRGAPSAQLPEMAKPVAGVRMGHALGRLDRADAGAVCDLSRHRRAGA